MPTIFVNLPSVAANGAGTSTDVSTLAATKTFVNGGNGGVFEPLVTIEISNDAGGVNFSPIYTFQGPGEVTLNVVCRWARTRVSNYRGGGAPNVDVGADVEAAAFATLVAPAGDGTGAAVATNALPLFKTVQVTGIFRGTLNVRVSEDGVDYGPYMSFTAAGVQSIPVTAAFMQAERVGVPGVNPGLPLIEIAADTGPGGGGGGGSSGVGSNCLIFAPGSGETGPVKFDDWDDLYTALQATRADSNLDGCYTIMFDDTDVSPAVVPAGAYDMTHVTWEGDGGEFTDVLLTEGLVLTGLRTVTGGLFIQKTSGGTSPISDLGTVQDDVFKIGFGCRLAVSGETSAIIDVSGGLDVTITLADYAKVTGAGTIHTSNAAAQTNIEMIGAQSEVNGGTLTNVFGATTNLRIKNDAVRMVGFTQSGCLGTFRVSNSTKLRRDPTLIYTGDEEADYNEVVQVDPSAAIVPIVITLPEINVEDGGNAGAGLSIIIKNVTSSANPIAVTPSGTNTIDGVAAAVTIAGGFEAIELVADGDAVPANWIIVSDQVAAAGGVYSPPELWAQNPVPAAQADVPLSSQVSTAFDEWQAIVPGSVVRMGVRFTDAITSAADDATIEVTINGTPDPALQLVCNSGSNPTGGVVVIAPGVVPYVAEDLIGVAISTEAGFTPVANAVEVQLQIKDA